MTRRTIVGALTASALGLCLLVGCDGGADSGPTTDVHDADASVGHMVQPAGGPNSPEGKKAAPPASETPEAPAESK